VDRRLARSFPNHQRTSAVGGAGDTRCLVPYDCGGDEGEAGAVEQDSGGVDPVPASAQSPPALGIPVLFVPAEYGEVDRHVENERHREHDREARGSGERQSGGTAVLGGGGDKACDDRGCHEEGIDRGEAAVHELLGLDLCVVRQSPEGGVDDQAGREFAPRENSCEHE
jgi:hypothetical protein